MKVSYEVSGNFERTSKWLQDIVNNKPTGLQKIADDGVVSLSKNTPRDTGETANSWKAIITSEGNQHEVAWINTAHPNLAVNTALIIELGHGTGTGGYVQPRPYIKQAMDGIFNNAGSTLAKEMIK